MKTSNFILLSLTSILFLSFSSCTNRKSDNTLVEAAREVKLVIKDYSIADLNRNEQNIMKEIGRHKITIIDVWASWWAIV